LEILKHHSDSLRKVSFSRNKVTNAFVSHIVDGFKEMSNLEELSLEHLKDHRVLDWKQMLTQLALLSVHKKVPLNIRVSSYQTLLKQKDFHSYLQ
jgi:hypothetical protein